MADVADVNVGVTQIPWAEVLGGSVPGLKPKSFH